MVGEGRPSRKRSAVAGKGEPATCCSSRRRKSALDTASHSSDDEPEVIICTDSESGAESESQQQLPEQISTLPTRRAVRTSHEFAYCLRRVIDSIPEGRVASYGQCAALAGAPRNARQVKSPTRASRRQLIALHLGGGRMHLSLIHSRGASLTHSHPPRIGRPPTP